MKPVLAAALAALLLSGCAKLGLGENAPVEVASAPTEAAPAEAEPAAEAEAAPPAVPRKYGDKNVELMFNLGWFFL